MFVVYYNNEKVFTGSLLECLEYAGDDQEDFFITLAENA